MKKNLRTLVLCLASFLVPVLGFAGDDICQILLANQRTQLDEIVLPPTDPKFQSPARRIHQRDVEAVAGTENEKIAVAVFPAGTYNNSFDEQLKKDGYFAVAIRNPGAEEIDAHPDFAMVPDMIRWVMPAPASEEAWVKSMNSSEGRSRLKNRLKASRKPGDEIRVEQKPLTIQDYANWYKTLFLPEVGSKKGAILVWPTPEVFAVRNNVKEDGIVPGFMRLFFYKTDGQWVGGTLLSLSPEESSVTVRAAAFEKQARAKYEMAVRGLAEVIGIAAKHGFQWLSYGTDINFYGVDLTVGLQGFKSSLSMIPVPVVGLKNAAMQLVKILDTGLTQITDNATAPKPSLLVYSFDAPEASIAMMSRGQAWAHYQSKIDMLKNNFALQIEVSRAHTVPVQWVTTPDTVAPNTAKGMRPLVQHVLK